MRLDDSLAEAHTSLAFVMMHFEWDWPGSEKEFKRALDLNANYATAHEWYAYWFAAQGQVDNALEEMELARKADPLSLIIMADTSEMLAYARRFELSEQEARKAMELDPSFVPAYMCLADSYIGAGNYRAAVPGLEKILAVNASDTWAMSRLAVAHARAGDRRTAESLVRQMQSTVKNQDQIALSVAQVYSAIGEKDLAFAWLEKAYGYRDGGLNLTNSREEFRPLHDDPRYRNFIERLGLSPNNARDPM